MTKAKSQLEDNDGKCESCNSPESVYEVQHVHRIYLGAELGWGTMWLCGPCLKIKTQVDNQ